MNKEETNKSIIKKTIFLSIFLISQEFYLLHLFTDGLLKHYGYEILGLKSIAHFAILIILVSMIALIFVLIIHGIFTNKNFVKKFSATYLLWITFFQIWAIIVSSFVILNLLALIINVSMIIYLVFKPNIKLSQNSSNELLIKLKKQYNEVVASINQHLTKRHN